MSYADRVRAATHPAEAMLAIAEGIDTILDVLEQNGPAAAPADPWGQWGKSILAEEIPAQRARNAAQSQLIEAKHRLAQPAAERFDVVPRAHEIAAVEAHLERETDGEERLALEARLRLLKDDGRSVEIAPAAGAREQYDGPEDGGGVVNIPPPAPERQASRIAWAKAYNLADFSTLAPDEFYPAYGKGGPMWMYAGNRDGVMQMPFGLRQAMISDVMQDSDAAAQEMARDILKDLTTGNSAPIAEALDAAHAL